MSNDTVLVPLCARDGSIRAYAIIDAADAEFINQWRWHLDGRYAARNVPRGEVKRRRIRMHRDLLGLKPGDGLEGDHINRNKLDCRRANLRAITKPMNRQNVASRGSTSNYRGVSWNTRKRRWIAEIQIDGKRKRLGYFKIEADAAIAARTARMNAMPGAVD